MKLIYSHENLFLVTNMKNLLEAQAIEVFIKNEFTQGAIGEVAAIESWPELWVTNLEDFTQAEKIVTQAQQTLDGPDWFCRHCHEVNASSFDICWFCHQAPE